MKKFYISSKAGLSGICKYAHDFYELVLKEKGYIFIDSGESRTIIFTTISSIDHVHIEIGIFQKKEIEILMAMLNAGYKNVAVTLHDPPLLKYPFYEFTSPFLNKVSKFYDIGINKFKASTLYIKKIKCIYVLSQKGMEAVKTTYKIDHVYFLPHIVDSKEIIKNDVVNTNFMYLGFIGKNKGIEYALQIHKRLLINYPECNFYIAGQALGKEKKFYNFLKEKYITNVHYLGYVPENELNKIFEKASFSLMPFKNYKFFSPFSGSILYNLKKGNIVFTNKVNAVGELIENGINGFYLSGDLKKDTEMAGKIFNDKLLQGKIKSEVYKYLMLHHTADVVSKNLILW